MDTNESVKRSPAGGRRIFLLQAALLIVSVVVLISILGRKRQDWPPSSNLRVLVADFVDSSGESTLVQGLRQSLMIALDQSPDVRIISDSRISRSIRGMGFDPGTRITREVALAICSHEGIPYLLVPSLSRAGDFYLMSAQLVRVIGTDAQTQTIDTARTRSEVDLIFGQDQVAAAVRRALGEDEHSLMLTGPLFQSQAATAANAEALTLYAQALALAARGNYEGELSVLQHSVVLNPRLALAQLTLGELCLRAGSRKAAQDPVSRAIENADALPVKERHRARGIGLLLNQDYGRARDEFRILSNRYPSDPEVQTQMAEAMVLEYDFAGARELFEKAVRLDDSKVEAHLGLCMADLYEGNADAARKAWERASALEPGNPRVLSIGGLLDLVNNDIGSALRNFSILADSPSPSTRSRGTFLAAQAQIYGGRFDAALASLSAGIEADEARDDAPSASSKRLTRAGLYLLMGDESKAVEECRQITDINNRAEDITHLGTIYAQARRIEEARAFLRRVEKLPDSAWTRYQAGVLRGEIELASGQPGTAVPMLMKARGMFPDCRPLEPLARALAQSGRYQEAEKEYRLVAAQKAVMLFPPAGGWFMGTWTDALYETARCLDSLGKKEDALQYYRNYLWVLDGADSGLAKVKLAKDELKRLSSKKKPI